MSQSMGISLPSCSIINFPMMAGMETVILWVLTREVPGTRACSERMKKLATARDTRGGAAATATTWLLAHRRTLMCVMGMALIVVLDTCVPDLVALFGLCGSLGLGFISMILPATMLLAQRKEHPARHTVGAAAVLLIGLVVTIGSTATIILDL